MKLVQSILEMAGYTLIDDNESFLKRYPKEESIRPDKTPSEYPCFLKIVSIEYNEYSADKYIIDILYLQDFTD